MKYAFAKYKITKLKKAEAKRQQEEDAKKKKKKKPVAKAVDPMEKRVT